MTTEQKNETLPQSGEQDEVSDLVKEVALILEKQERGETLTVEEENKLLCIELARLKGDLVHTRNLLGEMVKNLCAVIYLFHRGNLHIDKAQFSNFCNQLNSRVLIGTEDVTGNVVITVQTKPRKGKKLIAASENEIQAVQQTRIIQP